MRTGSVVNCRPNIDSLLNNGLSEWIKLKNVAEVFSMLYRPTTSFVPCSAKGLEKVHTALLSYTKTRRPWFEPVAEFPTVGHCMSKTAFSCALTIAYNFLYGFVKIVPTLFSCLWFNLCNVCTAFHSIYCLFVCLIYLNSILEVVCSLPRFNICVFCAVRRNKSTDLSHSQSQRMNSFAMSILQYHLT